MKNKYSTKRLFVFFLAIATLLCVLHAFHAHASSRRIDLHGIEWKVVKPNVSVLRNSKGEVLVGPGGISLWANYPYLVGHVLTDGVVADFIIDMRDFSVAFPPKDSTLAATDVSSKQFVGFYDLKGQWGDPEKLNALKSALTSPAEKK